MKRYGLILFSLWASLVCAQQINDWENQHVLQINREPARAAFTPYGQTKGDRSLSLDGQWKFRWTPTPDERQRCILIVLQLLLRQMQCKHLQIR